MSHGANCRIEASDTVEAPIEVAFAVAADIESYPDFVVGFERAIVLERRANELIVGNEIGWSGAKARFRSRAVLNAPGSIDIFSQSAAFGAMTIAWRFEPIGPSRTRARFVLSADFRSRIAQTVFEATARRLGARVMDAFKARAAERHRATPKSRLAAAATALLVGALVGVASPSAGAQEIDALAGHYAESAENLAKAYEFKRKMFLEPADIERGTPGFACDHLLKRKPQKIAGTGHVVLVELDGPVKRVRLWFPPDAPAPVDGFEAAGRAAGAEIAPGTAALAVTHKAFAWCK